MKKIKRKLGFFSRLFLAALIVFLALPPSSSQALFGLGVKVPSATQSMNEVMGDLGVDKNEVRYSASSFNSSREKKQAPQVQLQFSTPNPIEGQEVSVEATPMYFGNTDMKNLYFTWLLKHNNGAPSGRDSQGRQTRSGNTDWNNDGDIDREDYKIEAARIIASGEFDWEKADSQGYYSGTARSLWDNDGYKAVFGGDDQRNKYDDPSDPENCYVHNWKTGNEYQIDCRHLFPSTNSGRTSGGTLGDNSFDGSEERFWRTDPLNNDTMGSGNPDEANVLGLGQSKFSWNFQSGDKISLAVEGISFEPTQTNNNTSYKVMWAMPKNRCDTVEDESGMGGYTLGTVTLSPVTETTQVQACLTAALNASSLVLPVDNCSGGSLTPEDWLDENGYDADKIGMGYPTKVIRIPANSSSPPTSQEISGESTDGVTVDVSVTPNTITLDSRPNGTTHKIRDQVLGNTITKVTTTTRETGYDASTNAIVITDTDDVELTITDQNGNELYNTTWTEDATEDRHALGDIDMDGSDLNACLDSNFVSPSEGNASEKIKVKLTSSPDSPMNDPSGKNSDYLSIDSSVENVNDAGFLQYDWEVYQSDVPNPDSWGFPLTKSQLIESTQTSGLGVKSLKFKLAFPNPSPKYLKVKLTVTEKSTDSETRKGSGSTVVTLNSSQEQIFVYNTKIIPNPTAGEPDLFSLDTEICRNSSPTDPREAERNVICPVLRNEVIGLRYDGPNLPGTQYLWTLDGEPISYDKCFFEHCSSTDRQMNISYFPVLGPAGATYTVGLSVIPPLGQKLNLIRTFQVVNPSTKIVSLDQYAQAILLGNYIGLGGQRFPDYSETKYQAVPTTTVTLQANRYPFSFPLDASKTQWFVDGTETGVSGPTLSFRVSKPLGAIYTVSFNTLYAQSLQKKNLIYTYWGVMPDQFYETQINASVDLTMVQGLPGVSIADNKSPANKFLAAIFSGAPLYITFLFRIVLTTLLLLFGAWIIFSLFPTQNENEYKD